MLDPQSVGLNLKRKGINLFSNDPEAMRGFGVYLGIHNSKHIVAIKGLLTGLLGGEMFDTVEEIKLRWQLD